MPKITFSNQIQKPFWEEITKDILTPYAPKKSISLLKYAYEKSFSTFYIKNLSLKNYIVIIQHAKTANLLRLFCQKT